MVAIKKTGRKLTGGRYKKPNQAKKSKMIRQPRVVKLGVGKAKTIRTRGGNTKRVALSAKTVNLTDGKKTKVVGIKTVVETPSNRFLARQNILVKGAIIDTELGRARITNRPSQEGFVQAVILKN